MRSSNRVLPESLVSNSDYDQSVYTTRVTGSTQGQTTLLNCWKYKDNELDEFHAKLRHIFDRKDIQEIKNCIVKYAEIIELIDCRYPNMGKSKADWALAMALSPEWYDENLSSRLQNAMFVSALLLTVTASIFIAPPLSDKASTSFRILIYATGVCNMLFIMSIMTGIFFIENAMSRAYGDSERFTLIMKFYVYKNISQIFMAIGSALFPIVLAIPMWDLYINMDAKILIAFTIFYVLITIYIMIYTTNSAKYEQTLRLNTFSILLDPVTCQIKPEYYPVDSNYLLPSEYSAMFRADISDLVK